MSVKQIYEKYLYLQKTTINNNGFESWCELLDFHSQVYSDTCGLQIMPLVQLLLYARGELKVENNFDLENIDDSSKGLVIAYRDYEEFFNGFCSDTFEIADSEIEDHFNGVKNRVLVSTISSSDDVLYSAIEDLIKRNIKFYNLDSRKMISAFSFYDYLCKQPVETIRENLKYLFERLMDRIITPLIREYYGGMALKTYREFNKLVLKLFYLNITVC